ncbi:LuxR C-terminal-related transcriptional regulator [Kaistella anthropi]|nr:LuxR C-terminal-related transcriptional regulator [Kaistella anthropi]
MTAREMDVLSLICEGMRTKEIAEKLFISVHTVESHRRNIMLKLNINNSSRLVKYAIDHSLVK